MNAKFLSMLAIAAAFSFTSCGDDDDDNPAPKVSTAFPAEKTGSLNNIIGPNAGAYDLVANASKVTADAAGDKDMINTTDPVNPPTSGFERGWRAGNSTTYVKSNSSAYTGSVERADTLYRAGSVLTAVTGAAVGDVYIAKIRGGNRYAVIRISAITDDNQVGVGNNADKIDFTYKISN